MTPQEQGLLEELFDRLARLENSPRDPEAERLIGGALLRAPHAVYALVQTALIQDEALKRANARIEELQAQLGGSERVRQQGSFLDSMREAVLGKRECAARCRPCARPRQKVRRWLRRPMVLNPPIRRKCQSAQPSVRAVRFSAPLHRRQRA